EDSPVRLPKMKDINLRTMLRLLTAQVNGTYLIRRDHVEITTVQRAETQMWIFGDDLRFQADRTGISPHLAPETPTKPTAPEKEPRAWSAEDLRLGKIQAPDLSKVGPLLEDDFSDPKRGFMGTQQKGESWQLGYENGKYVIQTWVDVENGNGSVRWGY